MKITRKELDQAVGQQIISSEQADALYQFWQQQTQHQPQFNFTHILYYFGGLLAIGAMTLFMNLGWENFGGAAIVIICLIYAVIGLGLTNKFAAKNLQIPAGICATFVICLTPLAIFGLQQWLGWWPDSTEYQDYHRRIQWHWFYMELGTLVVGAILAWLYRYPFLLMPIAATLWYMSMDIAAMLSGGDQTWELRQLVSMYWGLLMVGLAFWVDVRSRHSADYAFWLYLFGVIAFWGGLSMQDSDSELAKFGYFCINLLMIVLGAILQRRIFVICGALGSAGYVGYLAHNLFEDSWFFPIALTLIGLGIIYLGVLWQKQAWPEKIRQLALERLGLALKE